MKGNSTLLNWLPMIFISFLLSSCQKTKFPWQPGISSPKYYLIGDVKVDFGNAGHGSITNFDSGWGNEYGAVVSGNKYKVPPKEVFIHYSSCAENYTYTGKVKLPQEKILNLFRKYSINDNNTAHLVAGMAPGGWIRIWFQTIDRKANDLVNIEIAKAKLKGSYDDTADERYKIKNFENWGKYYVYWQHHGIPYEAWATNEKEYDMYFDFNNPNQREVEFSYTSQDGTYEQGVGIGKKFHKKLPVEIELAWHGKSKEIFYCSKVIMPKNLKTVLETKALKTLIFRLEIDDDDQNATLYLVFNGIKEKILRFKNKQPTEKEKNDNEYAYVSEVKYFLK